MKTGEIIFKHKCGSCLLINKRDRAYLLAGNDISNINSSLRISGHINRYNLIIVVADTEVQVRVEIHTCTLDRLSKQELFMRDFPHIPPHRKIIQKHFKEIVILNCLFEFFQLYLNHWSVKKIDGDWSQKLV